MDGDCTLEWLADEYDPGRSAGRLLYPPWPTAAGSRLRHRPLRLPGKPPPSGGGREVAVTAVSVWSAVLLAVAYPPQKSKSRTPRLSVVFRFRLRRHGERDISVARRRRSTYRQHQPPRRGESTGSALPLPIPPKFLNVSSHIVFECTTRA